jgi:hypothetical protein
VSLKQVSLEPQNSQKSVLEALQVEKDVIEHEWNPVLSNQRRIITVDVPIPV